MVHIYHFLFPPNVALFLDVITYVMLTFLHALFARFYESAYIIGNATSVRLHKSVCVRASVFASV